jgi:hypothetical protein
MKKYIFSLMLSTMVCVGHQATADMAKFTSTGNPVRATQSKSEWSVVTDNNANASYQLISQQIPVKPGNIVEVTYDITVSKGKISLGLLNTKKVAWYEPELLLEEGKHKGSYKRVVPAGEKDTVLVVRNYHLKTPGQSTFSVNKVEYNVLKN